MFLPKYRLYLWFLSKIKFAAKWVVLSNYPPDVHGYTCDRPPKCQSDNACNLSSAARITPHPQDPHLL